MKKRNSWKPPECTILYSLASQCMEGHWMWDYQMCEAAENIIREWKGHIYAHTCIYNLFQKISKVLEIQILSHRIFDHENV